MTIQEKILTLTETDAWVASQREAGHRIGFTCGAFDLLHAGHGQYLEEARGLCDSLLVAVNSDESIQRYKNPLRPVNPWTQRAYLVAALGSVDRVTALEENRPFSLITRWKPDLYIKGGDYSTGSLRSASVVEAYGGRTVVITPQFGTSSTRLIERIQTLSLHAQPAPADQRHPAGLVLLDRDGTLIPDAGFDPGQVALLPGVAEALRDLQSAGFLLCLVSNQQGIGLGYFGYRDFVDGNRKLLAALGAEGVLVAKIYFCPHSVGESCQCRKPAPGMLLRAMRDHQIPSDRTFLIGDTSADMEAAAAAGCQGFFVGSKSSKYPVVDFRTASQRILASLGPAY